MVSQDRCTHTLPTFIASFFNLSLSTSTVLRQWKQAWISPVAKVAVPTQHADFRPISITPVLTRIMERTVVQSYIYPAIQQPPACLTFDDQFAFRPTGSTTAAIITILHKVTHLLVNNPYFIVIATVKPSTRSGTARCWQKRLN